MFVAVNFFTQFGKFLFACLVYRYNNVMSTGDISSTVFPLIIFLLFQIVVNLVYIDYKKAKSSLKKMIGENVLISEGDDDGFSLWGFMRIPLPTNISKSRKKKNDTDSKYKKSDTDSKNKDADTNGDIDGDRDIDEYEDEDSYLNSKKYEKDEQNNTNEKNNANEKNTTLTSLTTNYASHVIYNIRNQGILRQITKPINLLITNYRSQVYKLVFLNISLGIQFFSMINVFPYIKRDNEPAATNNTSTNLVNEIFTSKMYHTVGFSLLPFIFLSNKLTRKFTLTLTLILSLIFNFFVIHFNSGIWIHFFRFMWNVIYVIVSLYSVESVPKRLRGTASSIIYTIFKFTCVVWILLVDKIISVSIFIPIILNIVLIVVDLVIVSKLSIETHMRSTEEIEFDLKTDVVE